MVNVMIVEDEGLFRDMLKISLEAVPNMEVVGAVGDGNAAIDAANRYNPDVILMDIELGSDPNGISAGRSIRSEHPDMGIVILSSHRALRLLEITGDKTDIRVRFQESTMQPVQVFQSTHSPRAPPIRKAAKLGYWETE